ncbi:MAG: excinuclease ABC subunit UvrC [Acidaminococcaceae bacterium]
MKEALAKTLAVLPNSPGVYLMHDAEGKIIYVGKAVVLKNRVRSYFRQLATHTPKVKALVAKVCEIETIVTANEMEALILECNLIKKYRPRYNISLKDDKTYPYLKVTLQEEFPRLYVTRKILRDGAKYYGPYADAGALHATVKLIRSMFPLRNCRKLNVDRPCLQYHIKRCLAPCTGQISVADYGQMIQAILLLLDGRTAELERNLKQRMQTAADAYNFEAAARLRDQLQAVANLNAQQKAVTDGGDQDAIALARDATGVCIQIFFVRAGKLVGRDNFFLKEEAEENAVTLLTAFLQQYYHEATFVPREILLPLLPVAEERELLTAWLTTKAGHKVELLAPQRGLKHELLKMVLENAHKHLEERLRKGKISLLTDEEAAEELQLALGLAQPLARMDCFDISHTQGTETVASMVVFRHGKPSKKDYRKYKIISAEGKPDDFKSMQEVVYRRYSPLADLPSLVVIDGGKGQLSSALEVIRGLGLHEVPVIGLAKREEEIFVEGVSESIILEKASAALHLIQRIRDEAHRFAITFHRQLRSKRNLVSVLDHIEGIGPTRRQNLWRIFGSLDAMKAATVTELAAVDGMNYPSAQKLYDFFRMDIVAKKDTAAPQLRIE